MQFVDMTFYMKNFEAEVDFESSLPICHMSLISVKGVSGFAVCLFISKNIHICCELDISVNMAIEQG